MTARANARGTVGAMLCVGAAVAAILPRMVIVRGDDFGYLDAVVGTIRRGALMSSHWLEPFNLVLPAASAGAYAIGGNFWVATMGLVAAVALFNVALLRAWLRPGDLAGEVAVLGVVLVPVWLNKTVEFTGVPVGLAMTLGALLAWRGEKRWWFFPLVAIAVANRQSAVCLLVLPLVELARGWQRERKLDGWLVFGTLFVAVGTWWLTQAMPPTFARVINAARWREEFSIAGLLGNLALAGVMLAGVRAAWDALRGELSVAVFRENLARPWLPLAVTGLGAWVVLGDAAELLCETPGMERAGAAILVLATFGGAWFGRWRVWPPLEAVACAGAYALLISLRGRWWDYYFLEPALVLGWPAAVVASRPLARCWPAGLLLACGVGYAVLLGGYLDRGARRVTDYERALRAEELTIVEATDAPFGFLGWKLFATARARGVADARLIDFLKYVEGARARWVDGRLVVDREGGRRSLHPSREKRPLPPDWCEPRFPLSNAEWAEFLRSPGP